jgi:phage terminase large subunit
MLPQPKTYYDLKACKKRVAIFQGGTRSGKTYSIILLLVEWCLNNSNSGYTITVVRKSFPSLRASVLRDFIFILKSENWYSEVYHNKTENTYDLWGTRWEFISIDQPSKIRGAKREICFINECNELTLEDFRQLILRTSERMILDYNPSDEYHWIYDEVIPREDANFYRSTYKDNPFLGDETIKEIERLKETDENYWRVYGLGIRGKSRETIFETSIYTELPEHAKLVAYGLDFGFSNDPTALAKVYLHDNEIYIEELIYQGGLTNSDIAEKLTEYGVTRHDEIIADSAEPKSIETIHRLNFNIKGARKGADSIRVGIDTMRRHKLFVKDDSLNAQKEFRNYKWKTDKNGKMLATPVDSYNHLIDAVRYVCLNKILRKTGKYFIT